MRILFLVFSAFAFSGCGVVGWFFPPINSYIAENDGKAELAQASYNRQIKVKEAEARLESAKLDAQAEIERARGVSEANKIIGQSLKDNEAYLRWLYIEALKDRDNMTTIYIPTEAGLPILEAGKRK